jgi:hypothetical protein
MDLHDESSLWLCSFLSLLSECIEHKLSISIKSARVTGLKKYFSYLSFVFEKSFSYSDSLPDSLGFSCCNLISALFLLKLFNFFYCYCLLQVYMADSFC